ncbi:MAG: conserved rane protein of unknown function [Frankiales bacterium]|nr:conserved rane protein of unknown function [Frankiales bacterium]
MALGRKKNAGKGGTPKPKRTGPSRRERLQQIKAAFSMTRKADPKMLPLVIAAFLLTMAVFVLLGVLTGQTIFVPIIGVLFAVLITAAVFGRRVQKAAYAQVDGQLGAAAAILQNMRGNWRVTPAVGFTKEQDLVHRVIGRPGIVLVAEGNPQRVRSVIGAEKRNLARVVGDTPVYDVTVGDGEGQVPLKGLEKHFLRLPRNIKPAQVNVLDARLKALRTNAPLPIPKGPMPTRVPRGKAR